MMYGVRLCDVKTCHFLLYFCFVHVNNALQILGVYSMDSNSNTGDEGTLILNVNAEARIRIIGLDLTNTTMYLTQHRHDCKDGPASRIAYVRTSSSNSGEVSIFVQSIYGDRTLFICVKDVNHTGVDYVHQGTQKWLTFVVQDKARDKYYLPLWVQILSCVVLLILSGLFSGLTLGLLSLDQTELKIISKAGSDKEKRWAKRIAPLRKRGNLLLCSFLLGNVIVNSTFTLLFDNMTDGLIALICSTLGIVIMGEIVPQAICSRHGLAVGANTYWLTYIFMAITFPASYPISLILDKILGEDMGQIYNKEKLQELIRMTADSRVLQDNEANIMSGALQLTSKQVEDVMTKVHDVFMLEIHRTLDFETLTEIMQHGFTRVPVYDGDSSHIVFLLNTKDLALIDPDDKIPLSTVCKFYQHRPLYVDHDFKLDAMLQEFLKGDSHMAVVQRLHNVDNHDPYYETLGIVTLEDVLEEILQREIIDEKDSIIENRLRVPRHRNKQDYEIFGADAQKSTLPKQLAFVAFQFLSTSVELFSENVLAKQVLINLMKKDIVINLTPTDPVTKQNYIYQKGVPTDKFVLILQGSVEVTAGEENMVFESGPFTYFGKDALDLVRKQSTLNVMKAKEYVPDFSVRAVTEVQYLCINRSLYLVALRTTAMLRGNEGMTVTETFEAEMENVARLNTFYNHGSFSPTDMTRYEYLRLNEDQRSRLSSCSVNLDQSVTPDKNGKLSPILTNTLQHKACKYPDDNKGDLPSSNKECSILSPQLWHHTPQTRQDNGNIGWSIGSDDSLSPPGRDQTNAAVKDSFIIMETNWDNDTRVLDTIPLVNMNSTEKMEAQLERSTNVQVNVDENEELVPLIHNTKMSQL